MTRARNLAGLSTVTAQTTTTTPVHLGPLGVVTATTYYGTFDQASYNAVSVATTNLVISGITTGLNVSGVATFQNGVDIVGVTTISGELANINCTGIATFAGNVSIAGTLTYEDVTDIDSVGIVTARQLINAQGQVHVGTGVSIKAGGLNVTAGISTFQAVQGTTGTFENGLNISGNITNGLNVSAGIATFASDVNVSGDVNIADYIVHLGDTSAKFGFPTADTFILNTSGSEIIRIDSSGRLLVNTNSSINGVKVQLVSAHSSFFGVGDNSTSTVLDLWKTRATTASTNTVLQDGDGIGEIRFRGSTSDQYVSGAIIKAIVNGTPGSGNDLPTDIQFHTMPDGVGSTNERFRIGSDGKITVPADGSITFTNGTWAGDVAGKIQHNSNKLYIQGGTSGWQFRSSGGTSRLEIDANGMVAVGNITAKTANTFNAIEIGAGGFLGSQTSAKTIEMASNIYYDSAWKYKNSGVAASQYYQYQGYHAFTSAASGTADSAATMVEKVRIDAAGNLLVGTSAQLVTYSETMNRITIYDSGSSGGYLELGGSQTTTAYSAGTLLFINNDNADAANNDADGKIVAMQRCEIYTTDSNAGDDSGGELCFYTKPEAGNLAQAMRIDQNNKVVIAAEKLHSTRVLAKFGIDCQGLDIYDGVGTVSNYGMAFYNDPTSDKANGIGFFNDDGQTCGGYIVHQDKGGGNVGDLIFATSESSNTPVERQRIKSTGEILVKGRTQLTSSTTVYGGTVEDFRIGLKHFRSVYFYTGETSSPFNLPEVVPNASAGEITIVAGWANANGVRMSKTAYCMSGGRTVSERYNFQATASGVSISLGALSIDADGDIDVTFSDNQGDKIQYLRVFIEYFKQTTEPS